jgi:hypothetical protein
MNKKAPFVLAYLVTCATVVACGILPPAPTPAPTTTLTPAPSLTLTPMPTFTLTLTLPPTPLPTPTVTLTLTPTGAPMEAPAPTLVDRVDAIIAAINGLAPSDFKKNKQKTLINKLEAVRKQVENGAFQGALNKLQNDILPKIDGCALGGSPDSNDWITNCAAQNQVYPLVVELIAALSN